MRFAATGRLNSTKAWLGRTTRAVLGNSQTNRPLSASPAPSERSGASPSQPPAVGVARDRRGAHAGVHAGALPSVVVGELADPVELGVDPGQVVVLHEVLADELVVRRDVVGAAALRDPLVEPVVGEPVRTGRRAGSASGAGSGGEVDEQEEAPATRQRRRAGRSRRGRRPVATDVSKIGLLPGGHVGALEQRRAQARAVGVVGPVVVRAADASAVPDLAGVGVEQPRGAVPADVVEGAQLAVAVAGDDDRAAGDLDRRRRRRAGRRRRRSRPRPSRSRTPSPARARRTPGRCRRRGSGWTPGSTGRRVWR